LKKEHWLTKYIVPISNLGVSIKNILEIKNIVEYMTDPFENMGKRKAYKKEVVPPFLFFLPSYRKNM